VPPLPWIDRVVLIVLDGVGVGALPDAAHYGDAGSNTLGNLARATRLRLPNLQQLGLGNILALRGVPASSSPGASFGRMAQRSAGKDSTIGHWELMGAVSPVAFPTYPQGFPGDIVQRFSRETGRGVLGNRPASGTRIIEELYEEHRRTGSWILYTSADSVFQVAAHEGVIPSEELYEACRQAAEWLMADKKVLRVIARPFTGKPGHLVRSGRRDFSMAPAVETALDRLSEAQCSVRTIGKIDSLFAGRGITEALRTSDNEQTMLALDEALQFGGAGLYFANLIDFDMLHGHRNDVAGFAAALERFDDGLPDILARLGERDVLFVTADHGCDPTTASTDHSREFVPVLALGRRVTGGVDLGTRKSFADLGATICGAFGLKPPSAGHGFWQAIAKRASEGAQLAYLQRVDRFRRRHFVGGRIG